MKRHKYCLITVLVTLSMLLGLTSCGKDPDRSPPAGRSRWRCAAPIPRASRLRPRQGPRSPGRCPHRLPDGCCTDGASVWFLSRPGENQAPVLCRVPLDGGEAETLAEYQPREGDEDLPLSVHSQDLFLIGQIDRPVSIHSHAVEEHGL